MTRKNTATNTRGQADRAKRPAPAPEKMTHSPTGAPSADALKAYREKRDFGKTPEPSGDGTAPAPTRAQTADIGRWAPADRATGKMARAPARDATDSDSRPAAARFVVQKHWARRLHYDFRLEIGDTLKSWAVPKGPSLDPTVKRMAVQVEDHPLAYGDFEGTIPKGQYGAGRVILWDGGHWKMEGDPGQAYHSGKLKFELEGSKLRGRWTLVRMGGSKQGGTLDAAVERGSHGEEKQAAWLLIKEKDSHARFQTEFDVTEAWPDSIAGGRPPIPGPGGHEPPVHARTVKTAAMPATLSPQLATRVSAPPTTPGWSYELKYDGYRVLTRLSAGRARFQTRGGHDWTDRLPALARAFESQPLPDGWYDGEIVMLDAQGRPDFQALQNAFERSGGRRPVGRGGQAKRRQGEPSAQEPVYFLFDLPWLEQQDLRAHPLAERQARLAEILARADHPSLRLSGLFDARAQDMLKSACGLGLEGIIGKQRASPYVAGRSGHWIKLKCGERQEFVVGGYTDPQGARAGLGALLLGYYDDNGELRFAGKVGSGFSDVTLETLHRRLQRLRQEQTPFINPPRGTGLHWIKPTLAAEVAFSQWTASGRVRHAVFLGLREDKPLSLMKKEHSQPISNAGRLVDTRSGARKGDVAAYYERIAHLLLPHLKDRPVSLLRAPDGLAGELFFQKHMAAQRLTGLMQLDPELDPGHDPLVVVRNAAGLAQAAQLNVIEFHTWNAQRSRIDRPDRISFDLDPGQGVEWRAMQEATVLLHNFLRELELPAFVKTSGGKGLHVVVPILRRYDWDTVKGFSKAVVQHMADVLPRRFAAKSGPRNRVGKIFIDYLRNGFGATTVSAWSLRARPGMGVSVPVDWGEVETLAGGDHWTLLNIDERLDIGNQPWADYDDSAAALGPAMKRLDYRK